MTPFRCAVLCWAALQATFAADAQEITVRRDIAYREGPSRAWRLDLAQPPGAGDRPRPAIVVIHGGGWREGDKSSFSVRDNPPPGNVIDFARLRFVAVTINYRMSGEAPYPAALDDCKCAVRWLRAHAREYNIDPGHIGAFGNSAGGHLALLLALANVDDATGKDEPYAGESSRVQAAVSDSGPLDLIEQDRGGTLRQVVRDFMGGPPEDARAEVYRAASPASHVAPTAPPLLLIYGGADNQVPVETADRFVTALGRAGAKDVSYYRLAYVDHCPYSLVRDKNVIPAVDEFFLRTLMHPETAREVKRRLR